MNEYDVIVVGGGHAGCEAAAAVGNLGCRVLLVSMHIDRLAYMSCNPAVGGVAKGQIVREIDALGGYMGLVTDATTLQFRMLNKSKGAAMWSPRAQCDMFEFTNEWRRILERTPGVTFRQDTVTELIIENGRAAGVKTVAGQALRARAVVLTAGTFLNGRIHIGEVNFSGGRIGEKASAGLSNCLDEYGFERAQLKTGTPVRIDGRTIDFSKLTPQYGDGNILNTNDSDEFPENSTKKHVWNINHQQSCNEFPENPTTKHLCSIDHQQSCDEFPENPTTKHLRNIDHQQSCDEFPENPTTKHLRNINHQQSCDELPENSTKKHLRNINHQQSCDEFPENSTKKHLWNINHQQACNEFPDKFSFLPPTKKWLWNISDQQACYLACTSEKVHDELRKGFEKSPMFQGRIKGRGPRYCPSIEDKIVRFADKDKHQLFVEPVSRNGIEYYLNGFSSSLPEEIQINALRKIVGFENAEILRPGYAIEYDFFMPTGLYNTLETKNIAGLYFAGQINGTTGYEEAAAQGFIAGANAALKIKEHPPLTLSRNEAYIGVLIDDLITKGVDEPYRMFTSRAEFRILLRQDNADERLTPKSFTTGLVKDDRMTALEKKHTIMQKIVAEIEKTKFQPVKINDLLNAQKTAPILQITPLKALLQRPQISIFDVIQYSTSFCATLKGLFSDIEDTFFDPQPLTKIATIGMDSMDNISAYNNVGGRELKNTEISETTKRVNSELKDSCIAEPSVSTREDSCENLEVLETTKRVTSELKNVGIAEPPSGAREGSCENLEVLETTKRVTSELKNLGIAEPPVSAREGSCENANVSSELKNVEIAELPVGARGGSYENANVSSELKNAGIAEPSVNAREGSCENANVSGTINRVRAEVFEREVLSAVEIAIKYSNYIEKEKENVVRLAKNETLPLKPDLDYSRMKSLSSEAREKLTKIKPTTVGQAARISGVSPSDISMLLIYLQSASPSGSTY